MLITLPDWQAGAGATGGIAPPQQSIPDSRWIENIFFICSISSCNILRETAASRLYEEIPRTVYPTLLTRWRRTGLQKDRWINSPHLLASSPKGRRGTSLSLWEREREWGVSVPNFYCLLPEIAVIFSYVKLTSHSYLNTEGMNDVAEIVWR